MSDPEDGVKHGLPDGVVLRRSASSVRLDMPITRDAGEVVAWARLYFSEHEPIAVDVRVCALDGVAVLERAVQREDLSMGMTREVWCASARMRPLSRAEIAFEFLEPGVRLQMELPRVGVERFLRATEEIVKRSDEEPALSRSVERVLRLSGVAADTPS